MITGTEFVFLFEKAHQESIDEFMDACVFSKILARVFTFSENETLAHLLVKAGLFPSLSQARKNGWDKPIKEGWDWFEFGKKKNQIVILGKTAWVHLPISEQNALFWSND